MNNQKLRKLIRESFSSDKTFITDNVELDLYLNNVLGEEDDFTRNTKATIYWNLQVSDAKWGVNSIYPVIKKIVLDIEIDRAETGDVEKITKEYDLGRAVDGDDINGFKLVISTYTGRDRIAPFNVSINEDYKTIDIEFDYA